MKKATEKTSYLDFLELPIAPKYIRFKGSTGAVFPISRLPDSEIRMLFSRMADEVISKKSKYRKLLKSLEKSH